MLRLNDTGEDVRTFTGKLAQLGYRPAAWMAILVRRPKTLSSTSRNPRAFTPMASSAREPRRCSSARCANGYSNNNPRESSLLTPPGTSAIRACAGRQVPRRIRSILSAFGCRRRVQPGARSRTRSRWQADKFRRSPLTRCPCRPEPKRDFLSLHRPCAGPSRWQRHGTACP